MTFRTAAYLFAITALTIGAMAFAEPLLPTWLFLAGIGTAVWFVLVLAARSLAIRAGKNFEIEAAQRRSSTAHTVELDADNREPGSPTSGRRREP